MKCKICGSDNIVHEDGRYTCQSCGSVFYSAPEDDTPEVIKEAKEAIEAEEEALAAKKAEEEEKAKIAEQAKREKEAKLAEEILKNSEMRAAPHAAVEDMDDVKVVSDIKQPKDEDATQVLENLGDELKAPDKTQIFSSAQVAEINEAVNNSEEAEEEQAEVEAIPQEEEAETEAPQAEETVEAEAAEEEAAPVEEKAIEEKATALNEPFYVPEKMADVPPEEFEVNDDGEVVEPESEEEEEQGSEEEKGKKDAPKERSKMREVLDFCLPIIIALIVAMLLKTFVFANAQVPTGSMLNTIQLGDRIIASRIEYNFHEPERYDIIIFKFPDDVAAHKKDPSVEVEYFVKRIIGLPGETVTIVNGVVYVTDKNGKSEQLKDEFVTACTPTGNYGPYKVPKDSYFVLGDNRESSIDSRFWDTTNYVKKDLIIGKVKFRYYPSVGKVE